MKRIVVLLIVVVMLLSICACSSDKDVVPVVEDVRAVCDLATLKCYYHNVAQVEKKADNIFQKDRKLWMEYEGEAVIGIDMAFVNISVSGETVKVTMPEAKVLSIAPVTETLNQNSYMMSSDGWLIKNKITTEDQQEAVVAGQAAMEEAILDNKALFVQAEERAKELIENYIKKIGEIDRTEYTVIWEKQVVE